MTDLLGFEFDKRRLHSAIRVSLPATRTPEEDSDLRIAAFGAEFEDTVTMFAVFDGNEKIHHDRPCGGCLSFIDRIISKQAFTVRATHGPELQSEWVAALSERELKHLADARYEIAQEAGV